MTFNKHFLQHDGPVTPLEHKQLASYNIKMILKIKGTILQTTLPKRHDTRGTPSVASDELAVPKVSCAMK